MKTRKILSFLVLTAMIFAGCGNTPSSAAESASDSSEEELIITPSVVDMMYYTAEEAIEKADIIMIGEYLDEYENSEVIYDEPETHGGPRNERTYNTLKAVKVFKGADLVKDDKVDICHHYAFIINAENKRQLILSTELSPMKKGDQAIFLLEYNETLKRYLPLESQGRFPLPKDLDKVDEYGFKNGLVGKVKFQQELYDLLLEKYDIK